MSGKFFYFLFVIFISFRREMKNFLFISNGKNVFIRSSLSFSRRNVTAMNDWMEMIRSDISSGAVRHRNCVEDWINQHGNALERFQQAIDVKPSLEHAGLAIFPFVEQIVCQWCCNFVARESELIEEISTPTEISPRTLLEFRIWSRLMNVHWLFKKKLFYVPTVYTLNKNSSFKIQ